MPYITCPNGKTYSRYDQSPYVCDCIKKQEKYHDSLDAACLQDPKCIEKRQEAEKQEILLFLLLLIGLVAIVFVNYMRKYEG